MDMDGSESIFRVCISGKMYDIPDKAIAISEIWAGWSRLAIWRKPHP
jgi:hypothetical protein